MKASNSRIQCYKSCRRLYELKYIYGLKLAQNPEALEMGTNYHDAVEAVITGAEYKAPADPKVFAMVEAFKKYILPQISPVECEKWFEYQTKLGHTVIGRVDAVDADGAVIEHKTTSAEVNGEYWAGLENNEQILTYMAAYNVTEMIYTVCRKPTIRQKKGETEEEFAARCIEWFDADTETKIGVNRIYRSQEDVDAFKEIQDLTIEEMSSCNLFYRNENNCTKWGRMCEFAPVCKAYDPQQEYVGFIRENEK